MSEPIDTTTPGPVADPFATDISFEVDTDAGPPLPPLGRYIGQLIDVQASVSKTSGNPMIVWEWQLVSDMQGDLTWANYTPKPLYTVKTPEAAWRLDAVCRALGCEDVDGKYKFTKQGVVGTLVIVDLDKDEYKGQEQRVAGAILEHPDGAGTKGVMQAGPFSGGKPAGPPASDVPF